MTASMIFPPTPVGDFQAALKTLPLTIDFAAMRKDMVRQREAGTLAPPMFEMKHRFVDDYYLRSWMAPAGQLAMTRRHKTRHAFHVSEGAAVVWKKDGGRELIVASHWGITEPETERVLLVLADICWTTFHETDETDIAKIEAELTDMPEGIPQ